jgi:hypothetical protein
MHWGELSIDEIDVVEFGDDFDSPRIQLILLLGLGCLRRLVDADNYEERHQILCAPNPDYNWNFLHEALTHGAWMTDNGKYLSD